MKFNQDIFIQQGINDCQIDQLISFSNNDSLVKKNTSDPIRFKNHQSFKEWLKKGRLIYTLIDSNSNLLGITWFGQKQAPQNISADFTIALRLYGPARGQKLAVPFVKFVFKDLLENKKEIKSLWLETSKDNLPAIKTYQKLNFKKRKELPNNRIVMTLNIAKINHG